MSDQVVQVNDKRIRQSNLELLRIISMFMIIAMHYMTKGMKIEKLSADNSINNVIFWIIFAFCLSSVNVYVFISGYFAIDSKWRIGKLFGLWAQVLAYSVCIPLIASAFGAMDLKTADLSVKQQIFLPVTYEHYWFATAYIMLYLISPVLNIAISHMDKKTYGTVLIALIAVFGGFKSLNPYLIPWDKYGNDVMWFIVLYLIAGYLRVHGIPFIRAQDKKAMRRTGVIIYIVFSIVTFVIAFAFSYIVRKTGRLEYYMDMTYCYNYVTILIASLGLFIAFLNTDIKSGKYINVIAGYTFGVYLLHDNIYFRELWPKLLRIEQANGQWWQILHMIICIITVFVAGILVDAIRTGIFKAFMKPRIKNN